VPTPKDKNVCKKIFLRIATDIHVTIQLYKCGALYQNIEDLFPIVALVAFIQEQLQNEPSPSHIYLQSRF